ncbi:MAG: hypothetical protein JNM80_13975 [Phycisphaerae bacterium]|nr:hypothetical protein [Phycisphaerae bacterium]
MTRAALAILAALCLASCGHRRPAPPAAASPAVTSANRGLEVWSWIVSDTRRARWARTPQPGDGTPATPPVTIRDNRDDIESILAPYESAPTPLDDATRARLRDAGLRVLSVPLGDLDRLEARARLAGPVRHQYLGEVARSTSVYRGPSWDSPRALAVASSLVALAPGRLDLALRAWATPADAGPVLWVELAPRFVDSPGSERTLADAGAAFALDRDHALVLVPDRPSARWNHSAAAPEPDALGGTGPQPDHATVWETMLATPPAADAARVRVVLVLVPRLPARFELLAR